MSLLEKIKTKILSYEVSKRSIRFEKNVEKLRKMHPELTNDECHTYVQYGVYMKLSDKQFFALDWVDDYVLQQNAVLTVKEYKRMKSISSDLMKEFFLIHSTSFIYLNNKFKDESLNIDKLSVKQFADNIIFDNYEVMEMISTMSKSSSTAV